MFDGKRGMVLTWFDLSEAVAWADIIIIGEQHDDAVAHQVQQAIVAETLARFPRVAVSMEMLERDDQSIVDQFLRDEISTDEFIDRTNSRNWSGKDSWVVFYQPMIDAAKSAGAPVIAANAPRRFVRQARLEGYASLERLPSEERALFNLPRDPKKPGYKARFTEVMTSMNPDDPPESEGIDAGFRSQSVWDSTMAESIVEARKRAKSMPGRPFSPPKVIHLVGQFHSDFDGGLVTEVAARNRFLRILVISVQRRDGDRLAPEDFGRAAIVIYSGAPRPAPTPALTPASPVSPESPASPTSVPAGSPAAQPFERSVPGSIPFPSAAPGPAPAPPTAPEPAPSTEPAPTPSPNG